MIVTLLCALAAALVAVFATCGYVILFAVHTEEERMHEAILSKRQIDADMKEFLQKEAKEAKREKPLRSLLPSVRNNGGSEP